jgi:hypothetical protein
MPVFSDIVTTDDLNPLLVILCGLTATTRDPRSAVLMFVPVL